MQETETIFNRKRGTVRGVWVEGGRGEQGDLLPGPHSGGSCCTGVVRFSDALQFVRVCVRLCEGRFNKLVEICSLAWRK